MTATAAALLEPIPAHRSFGLRVLEAADARGVVALTVQEPFTNVIGTLHSSGLVALTDATGLAAIIAAADAPAELDGMTPLGAVARMEFLRPAAGALTGRCALGDDARESARSVLRGRERKAALDTDVEITDGADMVVARGRFSWRLRRAS